ncbi:protein NLP3 isoform X2 [Lycium barbarum]|uniref:protein NLP3 isoform X2 n=1 Tax=Lycium barbarum TaxID=112863 RepID=UPI00293F28F7|nr:protein NLP3 isoform X2 [Lycium barbarum]
MSNLQYSGNPIQNPNPITDPKSSLSFDEVSKCFNLPLNDAAESLGVCTSVLKKICYENGLVRWPYRKVISGKSIEDIKKEALREKQERSVEFPKAAGEKGPQLPNKSSISSTMEMPKAAGAFSPQQGTRNVQSGSLPHFRISSLTKGTSVGYDEFKYGFPPNGLSTATYKWWGNKSPDGNDDNQLNDDNANNSNKSECHTSLDSMGTTLLTDVRKRAVKEGKETLRLGVYRGRSANMLDPTKRKILLQVFKSYLHVHGDMSNFEQ